MKSIELMKSITILITNLIKPDLARVKVPQLSYIY